MADRVRVSPLCCAESGCCKWPRISKSLDLDAGRIWPWQSTPLLFGYHRYVTHLAIDGWLDEQRASPSPPSPPSQSSPSSPSSPPSAQRESGENETVFAAVWRERRPIVLFIDRKGDAKRSISNAGRVSAALRGWAAERGWALVGPVGPLRESQRSQHSNERAGLEAGGWL